MVSVIGVISVGLCILGALAIIYLILLLTVFNPFRSGH